MSDCVNFGLNAGDLWMDLRIDSADSRVPSDISAILSVAKALLK